MILWVDDIRESPIGYVRAYSVNDAISKIIYSENNNLFFEYIDIDHDAGDYANDGGDYIKLLNWLEETNRNYPIRIHSMNPVGIQNMRAIIKRNGWREIL